MGTAANLCGAMGARTEEARDRLRHAEVLTAQKSASEAAVEVERALAFYRLVGAIRYIRDGEKLLVASG
jgi:hypothetical protein